MARMNNKRARGIVNEWLAERGRDLPWDGHNYIDFVTEVRILTGIDRPTDVFDIWDRVDACSWLRVLARRIEDGVAIGKTLIAAESVH